MDCLRGDQDHEDRILSPGLPACLQPGGSKHRFTRTVQFNITDFNSTDRGLHGAVAAGDLEGPGDRATPDFRYRVLDPKRAKPLFDGNIQPYLMDPASGAVLGLPGDTWLGDLRSSVRNPLVAGKQYLVLFSNAYGTVKKGNKVTVVMGDCRFSDVVLN